ncbi:hypothetical protein L6164_004920 [Bauhinia variegata]|uniref:Uncharacterized protein n=1 Tax=Bauhinia variegata TaxID=167791 RepID=A0ACB9PPR8_BAUVA|nr:hypothetical protein L6164_004920 [Bauhinia variegata]
MKSSLSKLRKIALHKNIGKEKTDFQPLLSLDELDQAAKDMQEIRNCYDALLSAAAATTNSAYEFSESLREMGDCLLEKSATNDDQESGKILGMLGTVQLELQKLVDSYRSHIILTITNPSESLLNELRTVEDMKRQCDEKRDVYEYIIAQQKEKGRSKGGKGESITSQQLQAAHDEYEEEAKLCVFRLKSLKQGQSRSLLTQAARHYAAQLNFFRKGLKSLEAVEPHVRRVTEQQHIDYQFSGLEEDDGGAGYDDSQDDDDGNESGELSFDYRSNEQGIDVSASQNSFEMSLDKKQGDLKVSNREPRVISYSAPIFAEKKFDLAEKVRQLQLSSPVKSNAYVLPTPVNVKETIISKTSGSAPRTSASGRSHNLWHSSPLDEKKNEKDYGDGKFSETTTRPQSVLKESNSDNTYAQLPRPSMEGLSLPHVDTSSASDFKKIKRQAFSGPLTSKPLSVRPVISTSSVGSTELPPVVSGVLSRLPMPQPSSPKASPSASPPLVSSPRISELHELPRPPGNLSTKPLKSSQTGHSAPIVLRSQERCAMNKFPSALSSTATPLPTPPPLTVPRSFSIPSSSQRAKALHVADLLDTPQIPDKAEDAVSPPLMPMSLSDIKPVSSMPDLASHSNEIQGGS